MTSPGGKQAYGIPREVVQMCTADGRAFGSVAEALRMANATMDYLNGPDGADLDAACCGTVLRSLGEIQAKLGACE